LSAVGFSTLLLTNQYYNFFVFNQKWDLIELVKKINKITAFISLLPVGVSMLHLTDRLIAVLQELNELPTLQSIK